MFPMSTSNGSLVKQENIFPQIDEEPEKDRKSRHLSPLQINDYI